MEGICDCGHYISDHDYLGCTRCSCTKGKQEDSHCPDCGEYGEAYGHMGCQYPRNRND